MQNHDSRDPYRANFWSPHHLGKLFFSEATRLWDLELGRKNLTTVQAGIVLNLAFSAKSSPEQIGLRYLMPSIPVAEDLGLFGESVVTDSQRMRVAKAFTAWCLFTYQL